MSYECSIVTIVKTRIRQLSNLIRSIEQMEHHPAELIVIWMAPPCSESLLSSDYFDIHHKFITHDFLPIAKARNKGFYACTTANILYLDVDCICPPDLLKNIMQALRKDRVITSVAKYLTDIPDDVNYKKLKAASLPDPRTTDLPRNQPVSFAHFNTMIFAIRREAFDIAGGFDEGFCGYGVGDIDFATRCEHTGMKLYITDDTVLHQYHPRVEPPMNHLSDIVANATRFNTKWGHYPLQDYLDQFAHEGLINEDYKRSGLHIKRLPSEQEIQDHLTTAPY